MWFMLWAYRLGGRWLFSLLLYPVMLYFFLFNRNARAGSRDFLENVYQMGSPVLDKAPGWKQSFYHFLSFGYAILDKLSVWFGALEKSDLAFPNREYFRARIREGKGGVILASHLGNLEYCRYLSAQTPALKLNILVHTHHAQQFNAVLERLQGESKIHFIQVSSVGPDTAMLLQQKVDAGEFLAIVGDRVPVEFNQRVTQVPFLGKPASFPTGPFILASLMKCPVYTLFCYKHTAGYQVDIDFFAEKVELNRRSRAEDLNRYVAQYARRLEQYALLHPYQWFNFYDFWQQQ